jgi:zinc finger protein
MSQIEERPEKVLDETDGSLTNGVDYDDWNGVDMIESLCMNCGATGQTRLMLHKIPYFRELIIASFACEECGERNNEVTFGGEIQIQGCSYELKVTTPKDMDRQLIKSDSATVRIRELDFEIPPLTQKGEISTIEGILRTAAKNLALYQTERMDHSPEVGKKVADVIMRLTMMAGGFEEALPFHITVDDPAGNSYMENIHAPQVDPNMTSRHYFRTAEQDVSLGLQADKGVFRDDKESNFKALMGGAIFGAIKTENKTEDDTCVSSKPTTGEVDLPVANLSTTAEHISAAVAAVLAPSEDEEGSIRLGRSEVISIPSQCPNCQAMGESLTALTDIPHFKEVSTLAHWCQLLFTLSLSGHHHGVRL